MAVGSGGGERSLEQTPTWAVVVVCSGFVIISILIEQAIHHVGTVRFCQHILQFNIFYFAPNFGLILFRIQHRSAQLESRSMNWICSHGHIP
jgi:hypothetical protein